MFWTLILSRKVTFPMGAYGSNTLKMTTFLAENIMIELQGCGKIEELFIRNKHVMIDMKL